MGYTFFGPSGDHREQLIKVLQGWRNEVREDNSEWPQEVRGLSTQLVLETAVDELLYCQIPTP